MGAVLLGEQQGKEGSLGQGSIHWLAVEKLSESISTHKVALYRSDLFSEAYIEGHRPTNYAITAITSSEHSVTFPAAQCSLPALSLLLPSSLCPTFRITALLLST